MIASRAIGQSLAVIIVILIILAALGGYGLGYLNQITPQTTTVTSISTQLITSTTTSFSTYQSIEVTKVTNSTTTLSTETSCGLTTATSMANATLSLAGNRMALEIQPTVSRLLVTECAYSQIHTSTSAACGFLCANGTGYINYNSYELAMDVVLNGSSASGGNSSTVTLRVPSSPFGNFSKIFGGIVGYGQVDVFVNSQKLSWSATPTCVDVSDTTTQPDCITQDSTSMTFGLPSQVTSSAYNIVINSSLTTVP